MFSLYFKFIHQISRLQVTKITHFDPNWAFPDCNSSWFTDGYEMLHTAWNHIKEVPYSRSAVKFQDHTDRNIDFDSIWARLLGPSTAIIYFRFAFFQSTNKHRTSMWFDCYFCGSWYFMVTISWKVYQYILPLMTILPSYTCITW